MSNGVVRVAVDAFVMVVDGNGVVVQWSRQAEKLVGCTAEEVVGRPVAHLVTRIMAGACGGGRPGGAGVPPLPPAGGPPVRGPSVRPLPPPGRAGGWAVFQGTRGGGPTSAVGGAAAPGRLAP